MPARSYHHGDLRAALLEAGALELAERGAEQFSLRGVAKRAAVSHAAPAHHFGGKAGLLTALAERGFLAFAEGIEAAAPGEKSAALLGSAPEAGGESGQRSAAGSALIAAGRAYVDFALAHPKLFALMFSSSWPDFERPELDRSSARAFDAFVSFVELAYTGLGLSQDELHLRAMANWSAVHGLALLLLEGRMRSVLMMSVAERDSAVRRILELSAGIPLESAAPRIAGPG
ncbi:MAG: TetR/AcrR family transcriptional regulator [Myxococcota bacterium]